MKLLGLDGKEYSKDISKYKRNNNRPNASKGEKLLGEELDKIFPGLIYQEFPCVGTRFRLDFYVHLIKTAFEFDGKQHAVYVPHFHRSRRKFMEARERDCKKEEWCILNNIRLIRVKKENLDNIKDLICK